MEIVYSFLKKLKIDYKMIQQFQPWVYIQKNPTNLKRYMRLNVHTYIHTITQPQKGMKSWDFAGGLMVKNQP